MTQRKTAGKTATKKTKNTSSAKAKAKHMRLVHHRDGRTTLRTPDGRELVGTPAEVEAAGLSPRSRRNLAESLLVRRIVARAGGWSAEERRQAIAATRLEAIESEQIRRSLGELNYIPLDTFIMIHASARYMGLDVDDFMREAIESAIESTIEAAIADGEAELPLTRQERAAFKGSQADYCATLLLKQTKAKAS